LKNESSRLIIFLLNRREKDCSLRQKVWGAAHLALFFSHELSFCFAFLRRERTQKVHPSSSSEPDTSSIRSRCILRTLLRINEWARARDRRKKGLHMHICSENDWSTEYICLSKHSWIILRRLVLVLGERSHEEKGKIESVCGRWREKWQLIGIWVSSGKSSDIQQHLLLLPLKLLWDLKAPGLLCSPGTASDPCLAYTANRNTYLHQPSQLKRSPAHLCLDERRM